MTKIIMPTQSDVGHLQWFSLYSLLYKLVPYMPNDWLKQLDDMLSRQMSNDTNSIDSAGAAHCDDRVSCRISHCETLQWLVGRTLHSRGVARQGW